MFLCPGEEIYRCKRCGGLLERIETFYKGIQTVDRRCVSCGEYYFEQCVGGDRMVNSEAFDEPDDSELDKEVAIAVQAINESIQRLKGGRMKPRPVVLTLELSPMQVPVRILRKKEHLALFVMTGPDPDNPACWERIQLEQVQADVVKSPKRSFPRRDIRVASPKQAVKR